MMSELAVAPCPNHFKFLDRSTDFYREIFNIKSAIINQKLAAYLAPNEVSTITLPSDLVSRVSARLLKILRQQMRDFQRDGTSVERHSHQVSLYIMAALADEIFILELDWNGSDAWVDVLLEQKLFKTNNSGSKFFSMAQQLIDKAQHTSLDSDLAGVFMMALELGFKGKHRGHKGQAPLNKIRQRLYRIATSISQSSSSNKDNGSNGHWPAFSQAYQYLIHNGKDERLAPISPWRSLGLYALVGYLLLSMSVWLILMHPFEKYIGS